MNRMWAAFAAILAVLSWGAMPVSAQNTPPPPAAPPPIDPSTIPMPNLAFTPTPGLEANFDKYFFFNRADTDFATAYADLRECDAYARGLTYRSAYTPVYVGGVLPSAIGGAIGAVVADAIFGSAERRRERRINMLTCMRFKEYRVFGLPERLWEEFNFEEGNRRLRRTGGRSCCGFRRGSPRARRRP